MKPFLQFLKKTIMGGLVIVLPVLLFILLLREIMGLLVGVATPIANFFHEGALQEAKLPVLLALLLLVGASFFVGLWLYSSMARRFGTWAERQTLGRLPSYQFVKNIVSGLLGSDQTAGFKPAMLVSADGHREFAYIVEEHGNGRLTLLVPWAPTAFSGSVKIVTEEQVERMNVGLSDVSMVLNYLGLGARALLSGSEAESNNEGTETDPRKNP